MLAKIKDFYSRLLAPVTEDQGQSADALKLAAVALMIEVMRVDDDKSKQEVDIIAQAAVRKFGVDYKRALELIELAELELQDATDYHQFTSLINQGYDAEQKQLILEFMWQVAYADGQLDPYEEHVIRKVADLLYIPHSEFIRLKEKTRSDPAHGGCAGTR